MTPCALCGKEQSSRNYARHLRHRHKLDEGAIKRHTSMLERQQVQNPDVTPPLPVQPIRLTYTRKNYLRGCLRVIEVSLNGYQGTVISTIVHEIHQDLLRELHRDISLTDRYKVQFGACAIISKDDDDEGDKEWRLSNSAIPFDNSFIFNGAEELDEKIANYAAHGSNWKVIQIPFLTFTLTKTVDMCRMTGR